jgi:large exoprotein involved in heme utilization and adhesion
MATDMVTLAENARIDASGAGGGTVTIRGRALLIDQSAVVANTFGDMPGAETGIDMAVTEDIRLRQGEIASIASSGAGHAGAIQIAAQSVQAADTSIEAGTAGAGRAGDIMLSVGTLTLGVGARIDSTTMGAGQGGDVVVTATNGVTVAGADSTENLLDIAGLFAGTRGQGHGGRVQISTPTLTLEDFASISTSTFAEGNAGAVEIAADNVVLSERGSIFSNTQGSGPGGTITITAREALSMRSGGRLVVSAEAGATGDAGTIQIEADQSTLSGGALIDSSTAGTGRGGNVTIQGGRLVMESASINASTLGDVDGGGIDIRLTNDLAISNIGGIFAVTLGKGRGGNITIEAGSITLTGGAGINSTTNGPGHGGDLLIVAKDAITIAGRGSGSIPALSGLIATTLGAGDAGDIVVSAPLLRINDGTLSARTLGDGRAGNIRIDVGTLTLTGGAQIASTSGGTNIETGEVMGGSGQGGTVSITAKNAITISGRDPAEFPSGIQTNTIGSGNAGSLTISAPVVVLETGGRITSATTGDGNAGNLTIQAGRLTVASGAQIASASGNNAGDVGSGQGRDVTITADDMIRISGPGSTISSNTFGSGDAGNISISTSSLRMEDGGEIQAGGDAGRAGNIEVDAENLTLTGGAGINNSATGRQFGDHGIRSYLSIWSRW